MSTTIPCIFHQRYKQYFQVQLQPVLLLVWGLSPTEKNSIIRNNAAEKKHAMQVESISLHHTFYFILLTIFIGFCQRRFFLESINEAISKLHIFIFKLILCHRFSKSIILIFFHSCTILNQSTHNLFTSCPPWLKNY